MHVNLIEQGAASKDRSPEGNELAKELRNAWNFRHRLPEETRPKEAGSCSRSPDSQPTPVPRELHVPICFPAIIWGTFAFHYLVPLTPSMEVYIEYPPLHMRSQGLLAFLTLSAQLSQDSFAQKECCECCCLWTP